MEKLSLLKQEVENVVVLIYCETTLISIIERTHLDLIISKHIWYNHYELKA